MTLTTALPHSFNRYELQNLYEKHFKLKYNTLGANIANLKTVGDLVWLTQTYVKTAKDVQAFKTLL